MSAFLQSREQYCTLLHEMQGLRTGSSSLDSGLEHLAQVGRAGAGPGKMSMSGRKHFVGGVEVLTCFGGGHCGIAESEGASVIQGLDFLTIWLSTDRRGA